MSVLFKIKPAIVNDICEIMDNDADYFTIAFLVYSSGHSFEEIKNCLDTWPDLFRKSVLCSETGEDLYMLERKFGVIVDYWKSFQHLNYMKHNS